MSFPIVTNRAIAVDRKRLDDPMLVICKRAMLKLLVCKCIYDKKNDTVPNIQCQCDLTKYKSIMSHNTCTYCRCSKCVLNKAIRIRNPFVAIPVLVLVGGVWVVEYIKTVVRHKKAKDACYEEL